MLPSKETRRNCAQERYNDQRRRAGCFRGKMEALDPNKNEIYKFVGFEQANKIDAKRVMERVKTKIRKMLDHLTELNLNDQNLMKAINCRVIPVAGYLMNVCNLGKGDLD